MWSNKKVIYSSNDNDDDNSNNNDNNNHNSHDSDYVTEMMTMMKYNL